MALNVREKPFRGMEDANFFFPRKYVCLVDFLPT